jgi:hypothetical protein
MDETCSNHNEDMSYIYATFESGNCKGRHRLGDLSVVEKTISKWILDK